jgi:hypothetical protein
LIQSDEDFEKLVELATEYNRATYFAMLLSTPSPSDELHFHYGYQPSDKDLAEADAERIKAAGFKKKIFELLNRE